MGGRLWALVALLLVGAGGTACSISAVVTDTPLGFTIAEGLLLLSANDSTLGTVVLASTQDNCPAFQAGLGFNQVSSSDFLTFALQINSADGYLPLTEGTYTIVMAAPSSAGLYSTSTEYETGPGCSVAITGANSGTVTVQPFSTDGGTSTVNYQVVFGLSRFSGGYPLIDCVIPADATQADAGTCLPPGYQ